MKVSTTSSKAVYLKPDLLKKLDQMIHHRLTIVSAAVGYGKTTAVREYIHQKKLPYCWLNVYSQDIRDFWLGFCQLIEKYNREVYSELIRLGLPRSNTKRQFARIVADIPHPPHTVIVIDDYQRVAGTPVDDFIAFLLHELPEDVHLVLISRVQIFDSFQFLVRREMNRISTADLALDDQDIYRYYLLNGIALSREQCQWLVEETDGWIAYLYLYVLQYQQFGEFYQDESIIDLIDEIIYSGLSDDCKMFLNTLCIVNHFTLPQAEFVSEGEQGKQILNELRRKNAFLKYYPATKEYQFHKLFLTCIKNHFMKLEREKQRDVYGRMAEWFMKTENYYYAIENYFKAQKFDALLKAINKNGYGDLSPYQQKQVISYYQKCPEQIREKNPWAMLFVSYLLYQQGQPYEPLLHRVGSFIQFYSGKNPKELAALRSCYELQIALICHDDYQQSITHYAAAMAYLDDGTAMELPGYFSQNYCPTSMLTVLLKKTVADDVSRLIRNILNDYFYPLTQCHWYGIEDYLDAELCYYRGDFTNSEIYNHKCLQKAECNKQSGLMVGTFFLQMKLALTRGDYITLQHVMDSITKESGAASSALLLKNIDICRSYLYVLLHCPEQVSPWLDVPLDESNLHAPSMPIARIVHCAVLLENKRYTEVIAMAERYLNESYGQYQIYTIYMLIFLASAYLALELPRQANQFFMQALEQASPNQILMPFAEFSETLSNLFNLPSELKFRAILTKIKSLSKQYTQSKDSMIRKHIRPEHFGLTGREYDIAVLAVDGYNNKEIAAILNVSVNTVKSTMKVIYSKLGVSSRVALTNKLHFSSKNRLNIPM